MNDDDDAQPDDPPDDDVAHPDDPPRFVTDPTRLALTHEAIKEWLDDPGERTARTRLGEFDAHEADIEAGDLDGWISEGHEPL